MLNPPTSYTILQACQATGYSEGQLRQAILRGQLKVERHGRNVTIPKAELEAYVTARQTKR